MDDAIKKPLILQRKSRSSRYANFGGEANSFRDKLFRIIYVFLLMAIDFIMFMYSINGRLIENGRVNEAFLVILGAIFVFSFFCIMLLFFSKNLQNIFCAIVTMVMTAVFFYQFGINNVNNFLEIWFEKHMSWLSFICVIPSPWLVGLFFGILIFFLFRFSDIILFVTLVLLFSGVIGVQKNEFLLRHNREYEELYPLSGAARVTVETSLIYFMIPHLPSYQFLNLMRDTNFREVKELLLGFYSANNFEVYPNAFVQNDNNVSNIVDILNQVDYTSATSGNRGFAEFVNDWNLIHGGLQKFSLEDNKLYKALSSYGYGVSMYAMPEFNFCLTQDEFTADRCVVKSYKNVLLYDEKATLESNINALLGEWILSINNKDLKSFAKMFINNSFLKNMRIISENRRVSIEGSTAIFDKLSFDVVRDSGGQAYIVYVDLPSDIYIYDEYCNLKPRNKWVSLKDNTLYAGGIDEKRQAYADQTKCLVGKLQEFMDRINDAQKLNKTNIYIQGITPIRELAGVRGDEYQQFVTDNLVNLAIRKAKNPKFLINANVCLASDFTKSLINFQDYCYTVDNIKKFSGNKALNLKKNLINNSVIRSSQLSNIVAKYRDWWDLYKANNVEYVARQKKLRAEEEARLKREAEEEAVLLAEKEELRKSKEKNDVKSRTQDFSNIFIPSDDVQPLNEKEYIENESYEPQTSEQQEQLKEEKQSQEDISQEENNNQEANISSDVKEDVSEVTADKFQEDENQSVEPSDVVEVEKENNSEALQTEDISLGDSPQEADVSVESKTKENSSQEQESVKQEDDELDLF